MNALITNIASQRSEDLRRDAAARRMTGRRRRSTRTARQRSGVAAPVAIRRLGPADADALERLAGRDSADAPTGTVLGAEVDGRLVAAVSIESGELVADPFAHTEAVRHQLEARRHGFTESDRSRSIRRHGFHLRARPRRG